VDLSFSPAQTEFRSQVREWLGENVPRELAPYGNQAEMAQFDVAWQQKLCAAGWAGISWPKEYGGRGLTMVEQLIWFEEYARAGAPDIGSLFVGLNHAGPTLMMRGTESQKQRHLPRILSGEELWCQGFSEPEAGSDLASLRTRGVIDGEEIVVTGQKIWTSYAEVAGFQELLVRTDPSAPKHRGLTWMICPMDAKGLDVRTIETMDGGAAFCEVFYDDVRIPIANVVGEINEGWQVAMTTLSFERGTGFMAEQAALAEMVDRLIEIARTQQLGWSGNPALDDDEILRRLAAAKVGVAALRSMTYLVASRTARASQPGADASFLRLSVGELMQQISQLALDLLGVDGLRWTAPARHADHWSNDYLYSFSRTISAGTKDIQRNIIGERLLGLPR
jgi:alkylation response protein AidB-like acyl-CoA dehydrogenase